MNKLLLCLLFLGSSSLALSAASPGATNTASSALLGGRRLLANAGPSAQPAALSDRQAAVAAALLRQAADPAGADEADEKIIDGERAPEGR